LAKSSIQKQLARISRQQWVDDEHCEFHFDPIPKDKLTQYEFIVSTRVQQHVIGYQHLFLHSREVEPYEIEVPCNGMDTTMMVRRVGTVQLDFNCQLINLISVSKIVKSGSGSGIVFKNNQSYIYTNNNENNPILTFQNVPERGGLFIVEKQI
jgi:hypothetical protein